jgi:hypothetical protein
MSNNSKIRAFYMQKISCKIDKHQNGFDSWSHLTSMLFCHFDKSQFLRDISNGLRSATGNLNHLENVRSPTKYKFSKQQQKLGTL